jgi:hypothetical protein
LREEVFPPEDNFLSNITQITIKLNNNDIENCNIESFCISKGEFINFQKGEKLEKYVLFSFEFQLNMFDQIDNLFIDGTFKIIPKNWYQLVIIFDYIKKKNFYLPLACILLSSKNEALYNEVFHQLIRNIKSHTKIENFENVKIMADFELPLRKAIKNNFKGCHLQGCSLL